MSRTAALFVAALSLAVFAATAAAQSDNNSAAGSTTMKAGSAGASAALTGYRKYGTFFVGGGLGPSLYSDHTDANNDGSLSGIDAKDTGFGWHLRGGFQSKYAGAEVGYVDLGKSEFTAQSSGGPSWAAGDVSAEVEAHGILWSLLGRYPIQERYAMLVRIGMFSWSSTESFTENGIASSGSDDSGTSTVLGVGFEYDIHRLNYTKLRTEFMHMEVDDDELPVNRITGSVDYNF